MFHFCEEWTRNLLLLITPKWSTDWPIFYFHFKPETNFPPISNTSGYENYVMERTAATGEIRDQEGCYAATKADVCLSVSHL